jgi:hypothetical protein
MVRARLQHSAEFDYQVERHNAAWPDHVARTNVTAGLIAWLQPRSILDPACGDGSIVLVADRIRPIDRIVLNDISVPNRVAIEREVSARKGSLPMITSIDAMAMLAREEHFDAVVLTEFLEHLPVPELVLAAARERAFYLVASSPEMRPGQVDNNPEHLWMFDGDGYYQMLKEAGWNPFHKTHMGFPGLEYDFQVWVCK